MKKKVLIVLPLAIVLITVAVFVFQQFSFVLKTKQEKAELYFDREEAQFVQLVGFFADLNYNDAYIYNSKGQYYCGYTATIEDKTTLKAVKRLFEECDCKRITKARDTVIFQMWTRLNDFEAGICYTPNNTPDIEFLTYVSPLSAEGWYYYEADYNVWRTR